MTLECYPLTPERWPDLERLFGARGACGGCWCMVWRRKRADFQRSKGEPNREAFLRIVERGPAPGVIGYLAGAPVGWCAVAPRSEYVALANSRILKPVDDRPVWSVSCLFIARKHRGQGLSAALIRAAVEMAASRGARIVEAYPVEPRSRQADAFMWTGLASAFARAGFKEAARRSASRPIMRIECQ